MRMRKRYPVIVLLLIVAAIALGAALATSDASATETFAGCSCHSQTAVHTAHGYPSVDCTGCHPGGTGAPTPAMCAAACHPTLPAPHPSSPGTGCYAYTPCHGGDSPSPSPSPTDTGTPSPTPSATDTPTPTPSATDDGGGGVGGVDDENADDVGFPATGYPPSDGSSTPWLLITGAFAAGLTLLFAVWRIPAARRRDSEAPSEPEPPVTPQDECQRQSTEHGCPARWRAAVLVCVVGAAAAMGVGVYLLTAPAGAPPSPAAGAAEMTDPAQTPATPVVVPKVTYARPVRLVIPKIRPRRRRRERRPDVRS